MRWDRSYHASSRRAKTAGEESTHNCTERRLGKKASQGPKGKERDAVVHQDLPLAPELLEPLKKSLALLIEASRAALEKEARKARAAAELTAEMRNEFDDEKEEDADRS